AVHAADLTVRRSPLLSLRGFSFTLAAPAAPSTLSLHDALPISDFTAECTEKSIAPSTTVPTIVPRVGATRAVGSARRPSERWSRSEEHTSELQSRGHLVCRHLLAKKKHRQKHGHSAQRHVLYQR